VTARVHQQLALVDQSEVEVGDAPTKYRRLARSAPALVGRVSEAFANMLLHLSSCKSVPYDTPYRQSGLAQAAPRSSSNLPETRRTPDNVQCCAGSMLAASAVLFGALTIYCASVIVARMLD
jgi:hypothetical protein